MTITKKRRIRFQTGSQNLKPDVLDTILSGLKGVQSVTVDIEGCEVHVEYDLMMVFQKDIEKSIIEAGFELVDSPWKRLKRRWIYTTEENERANLKQQPSTCCSDPREVYRVKSSK